MGWRDSPLVEKSEIQPKWQNAPLVERSLPERKQVTEPLPESRAFWHYLLPQQLRPRSFEDTPEYQRRLRGMTSQEFQESSVPGRFIRGMEAPAIAGMQAMGGPETRQMVADQIAARERGMALRDPQGQAGVDIAGIAGQMIPGMAIGKGIAGVMGAGRIGTGALQGAVIGAGTPIAGSVDPESFAEQKAMQAGVGGVAGAAFPLVAGVGRLGSRLGQRLSSATQNFRDVLKGRSGPILTRYQRSIIGEENIKKVRDALMGSDQYIPDRPPPVGAIGPTLPGSRPTASEAVSKLSAGGPIQAHQKVTSEHPGGISAKFVDRLKEQDSARKIAGDMLEDVWGPVRAKALDLANKTGVEKDQIYKSLNRLANNPDWRAQTIVSKSLQRVREKLDEVTGDKLLVDARDLYAIRKELGGEISTLSRNTGSGSKRLVAKLEREIQKSIDDAIETAGGKGWKEYLRGYSAKAKAIADDLERKKISMKPRIRVKLEGGRDVTQEVHGNLPQLLSRPMMAFNFVMKGLKKDIEPALDEEAARRYLNPKFLAEALSDVPVDTRNRLITKIMSYVPANMKEGLAVVGTQIKQQLPVAAGVFAGRPAQTAKIADALANQMTQ